MRVVERQFFKRSKEFDNLCFLSKNLYNFCNYILRQEYFLYRKEITAVINKAKEEGKEPDKQILKEITTKYYKSKTKEFDLSKRLGKENQIDFRGLPCGVSQQVIKVLFRNWKSFDAALKDYWRNKGKYKGMPKPPKYKDKNGKNIVIFTYNECRIKEGLIFFNKNAKLTPIKTLVKNENLCEVRIIPKSKAYILEIVYERGKKENPDLNENAFCSIDLGINNIATLMNNIGLVPVLINGKHIKAINQYYNKKKAKLMAFIGGKGTSNRLQKLDLKRNNKILTELHRISKIIIEYCLKHKIKNIIIGYNKGWKQEVEIGKVNNQKFVAIPFLKLIQQIQYKADENGMCVIINEESYTSKCDSLALEEIGKKEVYKGKRVNRGLFQSSTKKLINADVNGAFNILRKKVACDDISPAGIGGSLPPLFNPVKV